MEEENCILRVTDNNISEAAAVYAASWRASHRAICTPKFIEKHTDAFQAAALRDKIQNGWQIYALYREKVCRGIVGLEKTSGEIGLLYVDPLCWGMGIGSALLSFALNEMVRTRVPYLTVLSTNARALQLYTRRGFVFSGEERVLNAEKNIKECKYTYPSGVAGVRI